ncbi:MAG: DegT/DnrJ/EryC1/StrS family aminotransferase [Deltaproteobacteria bacterium]|nr:MAG: DegT/DnrJ/EryC1/StrS family aminotransferase [Deltaproteobacteria bacterium]
MEVGIKLSSKCQVVIPKHIRETLDIGPGDEVLVPSLTFVATVNAVKYVGATPVFADVTSFDNLSICPDDIERKITQKTKAIICMHYGGFASDMDSIMAIAKKYNLLVVEDAAHAPDSEYKSKKLVTLGDIGCFSFFSNKNITCAEGGLLSANNPDFIKKAKLLRAHGMTTLSYERAKGHATKYDVVDLGYNYRMDDIRGALMLAQMDKLENDVSERTKLRELYVKHLKNIDEIIVPYQNHKYKSSNYIFPIILKNSTAENRDEIRKGMAEKGIQTSMHYPAVHRFAIYENCKADVPNTEYITDNLITLPLFFGLKENEIEYICKSIKEILQL